MTTEKPKKIGFDLDDVLLNFSDGLRLHLNKIFDKDYVKNDLFSFNIENVYGITTSEMTDIISDFYFHDNHVDSKPVDGAVESIKKISEGNELYVITAKPDQLEKITNEWLDKYFPSLFQKVYYTNHHFNTERSKKKSEICIELGIDIFIDDGLHNAIDISGSGIPVLLPDRPWNKSETLPELVTRVHSWEEIEKEIENLL